MTDPAHNEATQAAQAAQATRAAASAEIKSIATNADHPFFHPTHPGHQEAVSQMERLGKVARGETAGPKPTRGTYESDPQQADRSPSGVATPELPPDLPAPPEGQSWDPHVVREIQTTAADLGASTDDTQELLGYLTRYTPPENDDAAYDAATKTLQQEWGEAFDSKMEAARFVYNRLPLALQVGIDESGLGNDPHLIRKLAALGEGMVAAKATIDAVLHNKSHPLHEPYFNARHRHHEKAVREMTRLHQIAHGTRAVAQPIFRAGTE